jgi:glycosyltransferase involved in cell wall biosynthesis
MGTFISEKNQSDSLRFCVIVPTYNNHKTLARVLDSVLEYTANVIIVNDGSTDSTSEILKGYPNLTQIHFSKNSGKGLALRMGFQKAINLGYDYAITIDSDGQHYASDIPFFIDEVANNGEALLIGSRNMTHENVPKKSSFGNKFSNFWYWFETNKKLTDTQSGFRIYPLKSIPTNYFTNKFEFEIEVIVRSAWKEIPVKNIPINILYDPNERVSHFRPFKDFTRISILNTFLVIIALIYIKPRDFFRSLKKKGFKQFLLENILHNQDSNAKKSLSIALGVFVGISPFWGFQTAIVLLLAVAFRLNKVISFAFSNISFPPLIPFVILGSLKIGSYFISTGKPLILNTSMSFSDIKNNIGQYLVGSFILATIMAMLLGLSGFFVLTILSTYKNKK